MKHYLWPEPRNHPRDSSWGSVLCSRHECNVTLLLAIAALHEASLDDVHFVRYNKSAAPHERPTDTVWACVASCDCADGVFRWLRPVNQFVQNTLLFPESEHLEGETVEELIL